MQKSDKTSQDALGSINGSSDTTQTAATLARALGVRYQVINAHRRKPNAPAIGDVEAWRTFLAEISRNGALSPTMATMIGAERLRILKASAEAKERENKIKSGEVVDASEVRRLSSEVLSFFFGELDRLKNTMPSLLKGCGELEIFTALSEEFEKIEDGLRERLKKALG